MKKTSLLFLVFLSVVPGLLLAQVPPQTFSAEITGSYSVRLHVRDSSSGSLLIDSDKITWKDSSGIVKDSLSILGRFGRVANLENDWEIKYRVHSTGKDGEVSLRQINGVTRLIFIPSGNQTAPDGFELFLSNVIQIQ